MLLVNMQRRGYRVQRERAVTMHANIMHDPTARRRFHVSVHDGSAGPRSYA